MSNIPLNIMIIDDNSAIHQDFIKVLTASHPNEELDNLDSLLFDDDLEINEGRVDHALPQFIFDTACQGREGVEKIQRAFDNGIHYALAFVDIRMPPGWDGIETISRIWKIDPDIQIAICTAYSDYTGEETMRQLGAGDNYLILKKPFDLIAVRQLASALTRKWMLAKESKNSKIVLQETVKNRTRSLQQSLSLLRFAIETSEDGILLVDLNGKIIDFNSKFLSMWSIPESILKTKFSSLFLDYMSNQLLKSKQYLMQINHLEKHIDEISRDIIIFKKGEILECYSQPYHSNGITIGRVWRFCDVTERVNLEKKLKHQASHDALTGLPNRTLVIDRIQHYIDLYPREKQSFAVLYFDLDRLKLVNDSLSHEAGDKLLYLIARRWEGIIRKADTLARIAGDEFVMIITGLKLQEDIFKMVDKIIHSLRAPFRIAKRDVTITTSIGISLYPGDGHSSHALLKSAELAVDEAKARGGNQFQFYTKHLNHKTNKTFKLEAELRNAIENNEFKLYYQSQFDIDKQMLLSAEALIRWQHPKRGLLLPAEFIDAAETSGLIVPIGEWVINEACRQIIKWKKEGLPWIRIAVNIAAQQLKQINFVEVVKAILFKNKLDPKYLELEITENVDITHMDIIQRIKQLKSIGVNIVLDDFGTGSSSINYLKQIHIDRLKIDKSFVENIRTSRNDEVIIESIIAMARSFNFKVVAEGVETQDQLNYLKMQNCDAVQGFLLGKPTTPEELEKHLKQICKK